MSTQANKFDSFFAEIPNVLRTLKVQDIGMYAPNVAGLLYDKIHTAYHGTNPPRSTTQFIDFETLPENWKSLVTRKFGLNLVLLDLTLIQTCLRIRVLKTLEKKL